MAQPLTLLATRASLSPKGRGKEWTRDRFLVQREQTTLMFEITPQHDFLVGIDSDGCAFDTMEVKHKECFIPNIIHHYHLAGVSKYAREAAEYVNLYSKSRGINRFPALIEALEWLRDRAEVKARGVEIRVPPGL